MEKLKEFLKTENGKLLLNGLKSLGWRTLAFAGVEVLNLLVSLNMPTEAKLIVGLLVGELSKQLQKKYLLGKAKTK